jgi:hypothetical protein
MGAPASPGLPHHVRQIVEQDVHSGTTYLSNSGPGTILQVDLVSGMVLFESQGSDEEKWLPFSCVIRSPDYGKEVA